MRFQLPDFLFDAMTYQLGDAVGSQLRDVCLEGQDWEEQNPAALRLCREWLVDHFNELSTNLNMDCLEELNDMMEALEEALNA